MLQHALNVSYLFTGVFMTVVNPLFAAVFVAILYMRGEMHQLFDTALIGLESLAHLSVYIIPVVMGIVLLSALVTKVYHR